jgi:diguanylate cyclase (GGDEF)-like protein
LPARVVTAPGPHIELSDPEPGSKRKGAFPGLVQNMVAGHGRFDNPTHRIDPERDAWAPSGLRPVRDRWASGPQVLLTLLLFGVLLGTLAPICFAADRPDTPNQNKSEMQTTHRRPLIEQVRFNQRALPFEQGVTAGPGVGNLEIQFAAPSSATSDHLRYRLHGFDAEWKEAGKEREAVYNNLLPGQYLFEFEEATSSNGRGSVIESFPILVTAPYGKGAWLESLCTILLLVLILALHKLRVGRLVRRTKKLEETVSQTRAELVLAVETAGDAQKALKEQALKDSLTGLWNRRAIFAMLEKELHRAQRDNLPITLVMIDMDHFKKINDTYGHPAGDAVLREAANRLFDVMRPYDFAGRYGGEEFLIVLPSCSARTGMQRAEDFRRAIADSPVPTALGPLPVTCSLGVAAYEEAMPPEELIHRADEALYRAKRQGRNCVCTGV